MNFNYHLLEHAKLPQKGTEQKANPTRKFAQDFALQILKTQMEIAEELQKAKAKEIFTAEELSLLLDKHLSTVHRYISGEIPLPKDTVLPLSRWLTERGFNGLSFLAIPEGFTIIELPENEFTSTIKDGFCEAVTFSAEAVKAYENGDMIKVEVCCAKAVTEELAMINKARGKAI